MPPRHALRAGIWQYRFTVGLLLVLRHVKELVLKRAAEGDDWVAAVLLRGSPTK